MGKCNTAPADSTRHSPRGAGWRSGSTIRRCSSCCISSGGRRTRATAASSQRGCRTSRRFASARARIPPPCALPRSPSSTAAATIRIPLWTPCCERRSTARSVVVVLRLDCRSDIRVSSTSARPGDVMRPQSCDPRRPARICHSAPPPPASPSHLLLGLSTVRKSGVDGVTVVLSVRSGQARRRSHRRRFRGPRQRRAPADHVGRGRKSAARSHAAPRLEQQRGRTDAAALEDGSDRYGRPARS